MTRIVVVSDIHLSPTHGFFWRNWLIARDFANHAAADAVIVPGDLAINGPDSDAEIEFAASALAGLTARTLALPGNHDIGDEPPGQDPEQWIDAARLARWDRSLGADRWVLPVDGWRLFGLNAQLFGSGLPREAEQSAWLDDELSRAGTDRIALFLHKPLFLEQPDESPANALCMVPTARYALLDRLRGIDVRLIVSGHLHQYRDRVVDGIRHLWAPSAAFGAAHDHGGDPCCGLLSLEFTPGGVDVTLERPAGLVTHDLSAIKGHGRYKFLRDMPESPPVL